MGSLRLPTPTPPSSARRLARRGAALSAALLLGLSLTACGDSNLTAGKDPAAGMGGTFEFVSPGGQTSISYPPDQRQEIGQVRGPDLLTGKEISLDDYAGQVVVLNAWGQWCGPCRSEVDDLETVHEKLTAAKAGTVLGINVKDPVQSKPQDFVRDNGVTFPSIYDPPFKNALVMGGVPASVIPTTIVLDRQHRPAHIFLRSITDQELWDVVEPLIKEPSS